VRTEAAVVPVAVAACVAALSVAGPSHAEPIVGPEPNHTLVDKIVVASDRHAPTLPARINNFEIYLMNLDGSGEQRLTNNDVGDGFGTLSPDGKRIVFDSNRNRLPGEPANTSRLFVMSADGTGQTFLVRGGSPSWSPDGKYISFHASASGAGAPINNLPGAATVDSDIFIVNVDDLLEHGTPPRNLTNSLDAVDDDPDWSPDGTRIVYTSHDAAQRPAPPVLDYTTAEIYLRPADGTGTPTRLTTNTEEERGPNWSHSGDRISYACRAGKPTFEICVMNADGSGQTPLTVNDVADLTPTWSPDDDRIIFQKVMPEPGTLLNRNQLWYITFTADGIKEHSLVPSTTPTGSTFVPDIGVLRVKGNDDN
jgi:Tol biopolymer transport system component